MSGKKSKEESSWGRVVVVVAAREKTVESSQLKPCDLKLVREMHGCLKKLYAWLVGLDCKA